MRITRRRFLAALGAGALACAGTGAYAVAVEPTWLRTVDVDVHLPRLDRAFDGYRIAQISDLHVGGGAPESLVREAVERALAFRPDLVALTGDYVQGRRWTRSAELVREWLRGLAAPDGVLAVLGNHDAGVYDPRRDVADATRIAGLSRALEGMGARVLENDAVSIRRGGARLRFVGLGDLWSDRFEPRPVAERDPGAPTVALSHNPDTAPELAGLGVELVLSGHTHGGQVSIPLLGPPMLPVRRRDLAAGLCRVGETPVYVNRGVGWLRRIRFGVRPEVTAIRLRTTALPPG